MSQPNETTGRLSRENCSNCNSSENTARTDRLCDANEPTPPARANDVIDGADANVNIPASQWPFPLHLPCGCPVDAKNSCGEIESPISERPVRNLPAGAFPPPSPPVPTRANNMQSSAFKQMHGSSPSNSNRPVWKTDHSNGEDGTHVVLPSVIHSDPSITTEYTEEPRTTVATPVDTRHAHLVHQHALFVSARFMDEQPEAPATLPPTPAQHKRVMFSRNSLLVLVTLMGLLVVGALVGVVVSQTKASPDATPVSAVASHPQSPVPVPPSLAPVASLPREFIFDARLDRSTNVANFINSITLTHLELKLSNGTTPLAATLEERALHWLVYQDVLELEPSTVESQFRLQQRYALATLRVHDWDETNEIPPVNECDWGVTCQVPNGSTNSTVPHVTEIKMVGNSDGPKGRRLSPDLAMLSLLTDIDLSSNGLTGSIPASLGTWSLLVSFDVHNNALTGPLPGDAMAQWTNMERFSVYDNALTGTIPESMVQWSNTIQTIWLTDNHLTGSMPAGLCLARKLHLTDLESDADVTCDCCTCCV